MLRSILQEYHSNMADFREKINKLESSINNSKSPSSSKSGGEWYYSTPFLIAVAMPVIIAILLYAVSPGFIMVDDDAGIPELSKMRLALYTLGFSALGWGGIYGYVNYMQ